MHVLFLYDLQPSVAHTVHDHVNALLAMPKVTVYPLRVLGDLPADLELDRFDVVLIHYSIVVSSDYYLSRQARQRLGASRPIKAIFVQDEHRHVDRTIAALKELGCSLLFTCCPEPEKVYGDAFRYSRVLTGYVPRELVYRAAPPIARRSIDIGYRGRSLPAALGQLAQEKRIIAEAIEPAARAAGLRTDISLRESDRLYGERWIRFLSRCRAVLGAESGADVFDFGDRREHIPMAQISPRCFEAAALRTPMILYEGEYSGILEPHRHYIPLRKDHSNLGQVIDAVRDFDRLERMAETAFIEIALNDQYSFSHHARLVYYRLYDAYSESWRREDFRPAPGYARFDFARLNHRRAVRRLIHMPVVAPAVRALHHALPGKGYRRRLLGW